MEPKPRGIIPSDGDQETVHIPDSLSPLRKRLLDSLMETATAAEEFIQARGIGYPDGFSGIAVRELVELGQQMLLSPTFVDAYGLLAGKPERVDRSYYDLLVGGPELLGMYKAVDLALRSHEPRRVARGLDIATGTGMGALILSQYVDHVVATDMASPLLDVATEKLSRLLGSSGSKYARTFEIHKMDALQLALLPEEYDIVMSIGLSNFLTDEERMRFYSEVRGVLKSGGRYYEPQMLSRVVIGNSPRGLLAIKVGAIPAELNEERLSGRTTKGFPDWRRLGFRNDPVNPEIPNVGVMKLVKI